MKIATVFSYRYLIATFLYLGDNSDSDDVIPHDKTN